MVVLNVVLSNSFLSDAIVVSVLSVEPSTPLTALPLCLLNFFPEFTDIVFSQSLNNYAIFP